MMYFFLLSLFYISTTTRHTLENRRFLEANSNEKFCGTIRETLCECAAPSSMESYIYNIACLCVSYMSCVCTCMYFHMCPACVGVCTCVYVFVSPCTTLLLCLLSCFLTLVLLSHVLSSIPHFFSHILAHSFSLSLSLSYVHSLPCILTRPAAYTRAHTLSFRPPFSPSLSYFLAFRVRSLFSRCIDSRISTELNSTLKREYLARDRTWRAIASRSIPRLKS